MEGGLSICIRYYVEEDEEEAEEEDNPYDLWITKEGVAICSCNDGLRPVIMKIERTDEDSSISYEPVE